MIESFLSPTRTKPRLIQGLRTLALLRYATLSQLQSVRKPYRQHIYTKSSFQKLSELEIVKENKGVFKVGSKGWSLLDILPHYQKRCRGEGGEHDLKLTAELLKAMESDSFYAVIYPHFGELRPDACVIYRKEDAYRIEFLEVEVSPKEKEYLPEKMKKYDRLASDYQTYATWWQSWHKKLGLPYCMAEQFKFTVRVENGIH